LYSNAASADDVQIAASLYGLDPEVPAEFSVGEGGHIKFNVGGVEQSYEDYKEPMLKDFKTMNALLTTTNEIYNAGNKLNDTKIQLLGTQVEAMLADPKSIQSILSGDFAGNGIDLSGIAYNPNDIAGYAEKERKRKKGRNNSSNPSNPSKTHAWTNTFNDHMPIVYNGMKAVWDDVEGGYIVTKVDDSAIDGITNKTFTNVNDLGAVMGKNK